MHQFLEPNTHKCLGIEIDEKLSWDKHSETICKIASAEIGAIRRIKPYVPAATLQCIYSALVQPYFEYYIYISLILFYLIVCTF